jgi:hypothetical protein
MSKNRSRNRVLTTFDATVHSYGTVFSGFDWHIFGTGTFRNYMTVGSADRMLGVVFDRLSHSLNRAPIAYIAVQERRTSGCGLPAIPCHWHFVAAAPPQHRSALTRQAKLVWERLCGHADMRPYDAQRGGGFYLAKLAGGANFEYRAHNLDRMAYQGPRDLYARFQSDSYVPDHAKQLTSGQTLVMRSMGGYSSGQVA